MAKDAELDRLKVARTAAAGRKQEAYQNKKRASRARTSARKAMNRAHNARQEAFDAQRQAWLRYQDALLKGDPEEVAATKAAHLVTVPIFRQSKRDFFEARKVFERKKVLYEEAKAAFSQARDGLNKAHDAFNNRLAIITANREKRRRQRRAWAEQANVPAEYIDNVHVTKKPDGTINLYFGGEGKAVGPGHGHYVMNANGFVTYRREPFAARGVQNFTNAQEDYHTRVRQEGLEGDFSFHCQFRSCNAYARTDVDSYGEPIINIFYGPDGPFSQRRSHVIARRAEPFRFIVNSS